MCACVWVSVCLSVPVRAVEPGWKSIIDLNRYRNNHRIPAYAIRATMWQVCHLEFSTLVGYSCDYIIPRVCNIHTIRVHTGEREKKSMHRSMRLCYLYIIIKIILLWPFLSLSSGHCVPIYYFYYIWRPLWDIIIPKIMGKNTIFSGAQKTKWNTNIIEWDSCRLCAGMWCATQCETVDVIIK